MDFLLPHLLGWRSNDHRYTPAVAVIPCWPGLGSVVIRARIGKLIPATLHDGKIPFARCLVARFPNSLLTRSQGRPDVLAAP